MGNLPLLATSYRRDISERRNGNLNFSNFCVSIKNDHLLYSLPTDLIYLYFFKAYNIETNKLNNGNNIKIWSTKANLRGSFP